MAEGTRRRGLSRVAVVRLILFFFFLLLVDAVWQTLSYNLLPHLPAQWQGPAALAGTLVFCAIALVVYLRLVHWLERRPAKELAPLRGAALVIAGVAVAFLMFCVVYAVLFGLHVAAWGGVAGYSHVAAFAAMALGTGVMEELMFRGGIFRILEDSLGTGLALVLSGAIFGGLHLVNAHATLFGAIAIAIEAGVLLGAAYAAARNLWLPIGIHIGWNFTEGGVFGAAVSGTSGGKGILAMPLKGPELLTGGAFGPEASLVPIVICSLIGLYFIVRTVRRGRWVPVSFHMMLD